MLDKYDVLYGLRNLAVGDEEETRIEDVNDLSPEVQAMVDAEEYVDAYRTAIEEAVKGNPPAVEITLMDCVTWSIWFELIGGRSEYDTDYNEGPETINSAFNQAFEMWDILGGILEKGAV